MEKIIESGLSLGLTGKELVAFVEKNEAERVAREEKKEAERLAREEKKEAEKIAREEKKEAERIKREERKEAERLEREERAKQREAKMFELDLNEKEKMREYELAKYEKEMEVQILEKKVELQRVNLMASGDALKGSVKHSEVKAKIPKLPPFNERTDNMDSYLRRFERFAETAGWEKENWATDLSALVQGKALDVYSRLSPDDALNYDKLKDALLKRFQLTEEGFRSKFRNSKPETGETPPQFVSRLEEYLHRWMDLASVDESYDGLKDLILREQFMQASSKNLQIFLKERKVRSIHEMADLAEQYNEAHGQYEINRARPQENQTKMNNYQGKQTPPQYNKPKYEDKHCYNCKSPSHFIRDCPKMDSSTRGRPVRGASLSDRGSTRGARGDYKGNRGQGRGTRYGNRGRGGHNNSFGTREIGNNCVEGTEPKDIGSSALHEGECSIGDSSVRLECGHELPVMTAACDNKSYCGKHDNMPVTDGYVENVMVKVLRDTGCSSVVVKRDLVTRERLTGAAKLCVLLDGTVRKFPVARISVSCPYYVGDCEALCAENPVYDLILGNIPEVRCPNDPNPSWSLERTLSDGELVGAVQTRAQKAQEGKTTVLRVPSALKGVDKYEVIKAQEEDDRLKEVRNRLATGEKKTSSNGDTHWYEKHAGLIYRMFQSPRVADGKVHKQLLVPSSMRDHVLRLAHDSIFGGHQGIRKTKAKVLVDFYWPGVQADVARYCRSCDICQRTYPKGRVTKVPIGELPLIDTPFARVAVDIVGPIHPPSEKGNRFILTLVDYATRYPEAKALKYIDSESVAEALVQMFSRVGVPNEILSDMGKQFTSGLMHKVSKLLSVSQLTTTPYNPACNGLVEKFNGTLKNMLKKLCVEKPKQWDRYIDPLLFAYREAPQDSLGFSPFELLYGRTVRGPLSILKELWTNEKEDDEVRTTYEYVVDLRNRLEETLQLAQEELKKNKSRYKFYADRKRKNRSFEPGMKVLVLLPTDHNKLLMQYKGPFTVQSKLNRFDYKVDVKGKEKIYHVNLLRRYIEREHNSHERVSGDRTDQLENGGVFTEVVCVSAIEESDLVEEETEQMKDDSSDSHVTGKEEFTVEIPRLVAKETIDDVQINPELNQEQQKQLKGLVSEFPDVLTDLPGRTNVIEHEIKLVSDDPVRSRPYAVPHALRDTIKTEIDSMLKMGIIEPVESPYASPIVIVKKKDGTNRFCIDYRKVNRVTQFDAEPIGNQEEIFARLSKGKFFSKLDLTKGYWQIPVKKSSQVVTAFISSEGLYAFKFMPFGLVNAGATFCRMMRIVLRGLLNVENFVDDILGYNETWPGHLQTLRQVLVRIRESGLTVKPSKCVLGYFQLPFLGHVVGNGQISPDPSKIESIKECARPTSKKQIRSFLGLVGYYRKFIPNFSSVAAVLTDMTRRGAPSKVQWSPAAEVAFRSLIGSLCKKPILCLPDLDSDFIVRTDASNFGIGAVLMQEHAGVKFPISYASRKLLSREVQYSVIEKECLALVWGIQKFESYLYGRGFLLETDHQPLLYLNRAKVANARLMRWALALQPYRFRIIAIKGSENIGADFLSRHIVSDVK